ncbi:hypothetical protein [Labrys sp. (in: a-proteobacteria)]|uniref:hypothetical protein n=1 Tax=Labrys sp. (in: a-proteobacteria) TaxID=1917972 RepID=UPI0039E449BD
MASTVPENVTGKELAALLGISARRVRQLATAGVIPHSGGKGFPLAECIQRLLDHSREGADTSPAARARARFAEARARSEELRVAMQQRDLVPVDMVIAFISGVGGDIVQELNGLPRRISRDPGVMAKAKVEIDAARSRIVERIEKALANARKECA